MKILTFDASGPVLSVGIFEGLKPLAQTQASGSFKESHSLAPVIDSLLKKAKLNLKSIDVVAPGLGPGSFTGLRIGVTTAKIFGFALKIKIAGFSSLEAIVYNIPVTDKPIAVLGDAKKGKVYVGIYKRKGEALLTIKKPAIVSLEALCRAAHADTVFTGEGALLYQETLRKTLKKPHQFFLEKNCLYPEPSGMIRAALRHVASKKFINPFKLEPLYLHPRDCAVTRKTK